MAEDNPIEGLDPNQSVFDPLMDQTMPEGIEALRTTTTTTMYISGDENALEMQKLQEPVEQKPYDPFGILQAIDNFRLYQSQNNIKPNVGDINKLFPTATIEQKRQIISLYPDQFKEDLVYNQNIQDTYNRLKSEGKSTSDIIKDLEDRGIGARSGLMVRFPDLFNEKEIQKDQLKNIEDQKLTAQYNKDQERLEQLKKQRESGVDFLGNKLSFDRIRKIDQEISELERDVDILGRKATERDYDTSKDFEPFGRKIVESRPELSDKDIADISKKIDPNYVTPIIRNVEEKSVFDMANTLVQSGKGIGIDDEDFIEVYKKGNYDPEKHSQYDQKLSQVINGFISEEIPVEIHKSFYDRNNISKEDIILRNKMIIRNVPNFNKGKIYSPEEIERLEAQAKENLLKNYGDVEFDELKRILGDNIRLEDVYNKDIRESMYTRSKLDNAIVIDDEDATLRSLQDLFPESEGGFFRFSTRTDGKESIIIRTFFEGDVVNSMEINLSKDNEPIRKIREFMAGAMIPANVQQKMSELNRGEGEFIKEDGSIDKIKLSLYTTKYPDIFGDAAAYSAYDLGAEWSKSPFMINAADIRKNIAYQESLVNNYAAEGRKDVDLGQLDMLETQAAIALGIHQQKKKQEGGGVPGLLAFSYLAGVAPIIEFFDDQITNVQALFGDVGLSDEEYNDLRSKGYSRDDIIKLEKRYIKEETESILNNIVSGFSGETRESIQEQGFLAEALSSAIESLSTGAAGMGSRIATLTAFALRSQASLENELKDTDLSDTEKFALTLPMAILEGVLEEFGLQKAIKPGLSKTRKMILSKALKEIPKDASPQVIRESIKRAINELSGGGLERVVKAGVAESLTELGQTAAEINLKTLANEIAGKELFQDVPNMFTAEGFMKGAEEILYSAALGGISGSGINIMSGTVNSLANGFTKDSKDVSMNEAFDTITDDESRDILFSTIDIKVKKGEITESDAINIKENINNAYPLMMQIPAEFNQNQKEQAYNLLLERKKLQEQVDGKDKDLVISQSERINEINKELQLISKGELKDAVQEPETKKEVLPDEQPEVGLQEVGERDTEQEAAEVQEKELVDDEVATEDYVKELEDIKQSDPEQYWSVDSVSLEDAKKGKVISVEGGKGIVGPDGDIKGVFKSKDSKAEKVADKILEEAVKNGGTKLDNFDNYLTRIYKRNGFRVVSRTPFNEEFAPDGWNKEKHGTPDVVAMVYDPESKLDIEEKTFDDPETGYDEMIAYRDSFIETPVVEQVTEKVVEDITPEAAENIKNIEKQAENARKSISKVLPDVEIVTHSTEDSYRKATGETDTKKQTSRGEYNPRTKKIHINLSKANNRTVAHEVFHATLLEKVKTDKAARDITDRMIKSLSKNIEGMPTVKEALDKFAENYDENIQSEEKLAELVGILAENYSQLGKTNKSLIKRFLDRLAKMFGLKPFTDNEVVDVLNAISGKVAVGEVISGVDISVLDRTSNSEYVSEDEKKLWGAAPERKQKRTKPDPKKTVKAYKMFRVNKSKPGKLFPLFVNANDEVLMNTWLDAEVGELTKDGKVKSKIGNLAYRPGWHMGDLPIATHIGDKYNFEKGEVDKSLKKPTARSANHVWAEVEVAADVDWQKEANSRAKKTKDGRIIPRTAHITDRLPEDGYYRYKTNPNMTGEWLIGGSIKVTKVLTDQEVIDINNAAGVADLPRVKELDLKSIGFDRDTDVDLKVTPAPTDSKGNLKTPSKKSQTNLKKRKQKIIDEVKDQVVSGKIVSTSLPNKDDVHSSKEYVVGISSLEKIANTDNRAKDQYIKIAKEAASYGISKTKNVNNFEDAKKVISEFKEVVKSNLKWLHDSVDKDVRDISKLWYDGANKISNDLANEYGYTTEQVSGVMAVLSPQMDWFRNLSLGERVIDIYKNNQDSLFDDKMIEFVETKTTGTGKNKKPLFKNKEEIISRVKNKKLSQLSSKDQSYFIRVYDEVYNSRNYNNITPNGEINGLVRTKSGNPGKVGWGDFSTIEKSISILNDGSVKNISTNLGNQHKVRNFFNNISNPNDKNAVTIDTHAVAAALLKPLSGKSKQVSYNFGGASAVSTGMTGTYPVYADAYRELANDLGILPREVQSITWEAGRGLFKAAFKANKNNEQKIDNIWNEYESGSISLKQAQSKIDKLAGGISTPVWYEYLADENIESLDKNSAALDQAALDEEVSVDDQITTLSKRKQKDDKPSRERVDRIIDEIIKKVERRSGRKFVSKQKKLDATLSYLQGSKLYQEATDLEREQVVRELNEDLGINIKKAPSVRKVLGKEKRTKVTVDQMAEYKRQIKAWNRSARLAKKDLNSRRKELANLLKSMVKTGVMTSKQAAILVERSNKINLENETIVNRFINYAEKVFENAEYAQKFKEAASLRRKIKKALKGDNQAEVVAMGKKFAEIDPQMVEVLDLYLDYADQMYNALRPSRIKGSEVDMKQPANLSEVGEFYDGAIANQEKILKKEMIAKYQDLGLTENMSLKDIKDIVNAIESKQGIKGMDAEIMSFLVKRFDIMSSIARRMIKTKTNPFTGEDVDITKKDIDMVSRLIGADISTMGVKDAIKFVEYIDNFITNEITSGLESAVSIYEGNLAIKKLKKSGIRSRMPKLGLNETLGKIWNRELTSLPLLFERLFQGATRGLKVMKMLGVQDIANGNAVKNREFKKIMDRYSEKFIKNDDKFMDAENVYERGMIAFLSRNLIGTDSDKKTEFNRRKELVIESIERLELSGDSKERKKAEVYRKVYNNLSIASATDPSSILNNASNKNIEAVEWWINEWSDKYQDLSDVSLSVYNNILGTDTNYTPDKYKSLTGKVDPRELERAIEENGAFMSDTHIDRNKSGVLMETTRPKTLPKNRYVSFDFEVDNFNSMDKALTDIYTAAAIQKFYGAASSKEFEDVFGDTSQLIQQRVVDYINNVKGKGEYMKDKDVQKVFNTIAKFGVSKALGGVSQALKQSVPVMMNTLTNAGRFDFAQREDLDWVNNSGMSIVNRGIEAETAIDSADAKIDVNTSETLRSLAKKFDKLQGMYLKAFLQAPDVYIAKSSFISYYKQYMKRNGMSTDIKEGEYNQKALEYAQLMVDRQQNISDPAMAGGFLGKPGTVALVRKIIAPFSSFVLNQKARMMSDLRALNPANKAVTNEDRRIAARSLAGLTVELTIFHTLSAAIREGYKAISNMAFGDDDDEMEEKEWGTLERNKDLWNMSKYALGSAVNDILSPFPFVGDLAVAKGLNLVLYTFDVNLADEEDVQRAIEEENELRMLRREKPMTDKEISDLRKKIMDEGKIQVWSDDSILESLGVIGIGFETINEFNKEYYTPYKEGTYEYESSRYGTQKRYILDRDREKLGPVAILKFLQITGVAPKDVGDIARYGLKEIKKKSISESKYNKYQEVKKEIKRTPTEAEEYFIINTNKDKAKDVSDEIKRFKTYFGDLTLDEMKEVVEAEKYKLSTGQWTIENIKKGRKAKDLKKEVVTMPSESSDLFIK